MFVPLPTDRDVADEVTALRGVLDQGRPDGLDVHVAGPAGFTAELSAAFAGIDGVLLLVALAAVFVILIAVYRSPLLPILVLFSAMSALCGAILLVFWLAKADILTLNGQVQGILFILVIGAGWRARPRGAAAAAGAGRDPQSVLLNLLLGDQGKIFDFKG